MEGYFYYNLLDVNNSENITDIAKALSLPIRVEILRQLHKTPMSIVELAKANNISNSTVIFHLKILEKAKLITMQYAPDKKGKTQINFDNFIDIHFSISENRKSSVEIYSQSVPVGLYVDAKFDGYVRFATDKDFMRISLNDIYNEKRTEMQLLWTDGGYVTYAFSNEFAQNSEVYELNISLEICSETTYYRNDWKSDIDFYINGKKLLTYTSPGDFGEQRGRLNPEWWPDNNTQFGLLKTISVTSKGVFLDKVLVNPNITLSDLDIAQGNRILFSVGCDKNSKHYGGFNIFGKSFGNYPQDIILSASYKQTR